jgi:hypothetical protein
MSDQIITVFIQDQDGGDLYYKEFDSTNELLDQWPYAEQIDDVTFTAWIGGRAHD